MFEVDTYSPLEVSTVTSRNHFISTVNLKPVGQHRRLSSAPPKS